MATYNNAAAELDPATPPPDQGGSRTKTVPRDALPDCKPGDTYRVVSADDETVELEVVGGEEPDESEKWASEFRQHMSAQSGEPMSESLRKQMT